jgi:hypothetical protein
VHRNPGAGSRAFWLVTVCFVPSDLQKELKLLSQQATELQRTHFGRPPPKPDPPLSKRLQKLARKALLNRLREEWYARRLARKRLGKAGKRPKPIVPTQVQLTCIPPLILIMILSLSSTYLAQFWDMILPTCMVLGIYWWYQKASFVGNKLDKWRNKPGDRWYSPTLTFLKNPHGSTTKASFTSDQERDLWDLLTWWALDFAIARAPKQLSPYSLARLLQSWKSGFVKTTGEASEYGCSPTRPNSSNDGLNGGSSASFSTVSGCRQLMFYSAVQLAYCETWPSSYWLTRRMHGWSPMIRRHTVRPFD